MTALVLSPHLDDAVLCIGGLVGASCQAGTSVIVVTVFAGAPRGPLSQQAMEFHQDCGLGDDAVTQRRREDAAAVAVLGARPIWLDIPDAIYRMESRAHRYPTREALFGAPRGEAETVARAVRLILDVTEDIDCLLLPLGVGGHVDHRMTRTIGEMVINTVRPALTLWYEESLYQVQQGDLAWRDVPVDGLSVTASALTGDLWNLKCSAIRRYTSQLRMLNLSECGEAAPWMRTERIWRRRGQSTQTIQ